MSYLGLVAEPRTTVDQVYTKLHTAIVTGELASGSKISEPELARAYSVSRSTIREAISRLEAAHLVSRKTNVGARVAGLSNEELLEIYLVREALEGMACRLAADRMSDEEIADLETLVNGYVAPGDLTEDAIYQQYREGDMDFHYRVIHGSKNSKLIHLLCGELYPKVSMYRYQFAMRSNRAIVGFTEHQHIVNALADRDAEMAEMLMRRHIRASRLSIEKQLRTTS